MMGPHDEAESGCVKSSGEGSAVSGMVERVARAIQPKAWAVYDQPEPPRSLKDKEWVARYKWTNARKAAEKSLTWAARAIEAMREPTEAMVEASAPAFKEVTDMIVFCHARGSHPGGLKKDPIPDAWRAMIDAALSSETPPSGCERSELCTPATDAKNPSESE